MKFSAAVFDLDGTLLNSKKEVSERNRKALVKSREQGMKIIFATARPPRTVKRFLPEELRQIGSFIFYNGAHVVCEKEGFLLHEAIAASLAAEVIDFCLHMDPAAELSVEVQDEWYCLRELDYSDSMNVVTQPIVKKLDELKKMEATKLLISNFSSLYRLNEEFGHRLNIIHTDAGSLVQVMSLQASKERAVVFLCERYCILPEDVIVFGDDFNDIGLFRTFRYCVAMGNAVDELKQMASEVTDTNDNDGVAKVLERLLGET